MTAGSKRAIIAKINKEIDKEFLRGLEIWFYYSLVFYFIFVN